MTRVQALLARAVLLALLLLAVSGAIANADSDLVSGTMNPTTLPADPGYDLSE